MINRNNDPRKGMKVPDGFFEKIEDQIMNQISEAKVIPFWSRSKLMSAAAVFVLLIASLFIIKLNTQVEAPAYSELSDELNWDYIIDNYEDLTYEEIASFDESDEAILIMEAELYGYFVGEEILDEIDLETLENLYE